MMINLNLIRDRYAIVKEASLGGRYLPPEALTPLIDKHRNWTKVEVLGSSVLGNDIIGLRVGNGDKVVLAWSQMHGNESTTTRACFDLLAYLKEFKNINGPHLIVCPNSVVLNWEKEFNKWFP